SRPIRQAAEACTQRLSEVDNGVKLSRPIYDRLAAIDASKADPSIAFALDKRLAAYRRAGVDRDAATRAKIEALQKEITATSVAFNRNIRESRRSLKLRPEELAGLPQDWLDAHRPGPDGLITVTTDYPDVFPVLDYADNAETRRRLLAEFDQRAWPENEAVLKDLLVKRHRLANLLGYSTYAALITEGKMIGTPQKAQAFIDRLNDVASPAAARDKAVLLARKQKVTPGSTAVQRWEASYLTRLVRKEDYEVDSAKVRGYFTYDRTRQGLLSLINNLYGVELRPWKTEVWHNSVDAYEVWDQGRLLGRFYLDMHPREGKYNHAAAFPIRIGVKGRRLPVGALICNFPATGPMDHEDVELFFHEFGHLIHWMFNGGHRLAQQNFGQVEWDFVEAPSQMLEEWAWDYDTLRTFAVNAEGKTIPADLVAAMNRGRRFGEASNWKGQATLAAISLAYYSSPPEAMDLTEVWKTNYNRYGNYPYIPGSHPYASFGHLDGYSAIYYTYPWSKAIALDLFSQFKANGLGDKATARRYRTEILAPGGSRPAAENIERFLGRPFSLEPLEKRLRGE
ncbi:MAG TPA: M3 family metallopeptidase, partial [Caulobacter sp.]|nr:M3 family metallopeptidase [Caulobacter sp.]